ncbi:MAG: Fe-S cluster assembly protein SufD [Planctomycetota bacterium]|nr:Fe-S cluster assembly protein SufD [Planctomycetota bacterium]
MPTMTTNQPCTFSDRSKAIAPDGFTARRTEAIDRFQEILWPTMRDEAWRYTDTRPIASVEFAAADPASTADLESIAPFMLDDDMPKIVFVDGVYQASCSTASNMPGVHIDRIANVLASDPQRLADRLSAHADWQDDPASALSTALLTDGVLVEIEDGASMREPLHIIFVSQGGPDPISVHPRVLVVAGNNAKGTVIESHVGTSEHTILTTPVTELIAGNDVRLDHYRMVREGEGTWHLGDLALHQGSNTEVSSCVLAFDGPVIRTRMRGTLAGEHGNAILHGLALGHGKRHIENLLRVNHMVPNCRSREAFKHVLEDNATAAFTGRIYVAEGAQKTDAVQTNRNLLLSSTARSTARPQLEIYADDVKCTHGATAGELDPEAMFYLQARGVPTEAARSMLVQAFAGEILDDVAPASLRAQAMMLLRNRLPAAEHLAVIE